MYIQGVGGKLPFAVMGQFADGSVLDVTQSSYVTYASSNSSIASVDGFGTVKAEGPGRATISATYTLGANSRTLPILVDVSSALIISPPKLTFGNQLVGTAGASQVASITNSTEVPINFLQATLAGDFVQTNDCISASPLAPGAFCEVTVGFLPTVSGVRTGTVDLTTDLNPPVISIALTGIGTQDFTFAVTPASQSVKKRNSTTFNATVAPLGGFASAVGLSVTGLPSPSTAAFSPSSISNGSGTSTLTITTTSQTPTGTFTLTITGSSGALVHSTTVTLTVTK